MKKEYIKPKTTIIAVEQSYHLLAGSGEKPGPDVPDPEEPEDIWEIDLVNKDADKKLDIL